MNRQENEPKSYQGKEYTTYEALQEQRRLERLMRKQRQDIRLFQAGEGSKEDILAAQSRYRITMDDYAKFSRAMKLPQQKDRIYQDGLKGRFTPGKREQARLNKMAESKSAELERKARYSKFSERFSEYNNGQKDVITTRRLLNNLHRSNIGQETVRYISEHPELDIKMCYKVAAPENVFGMQDKDDIYIYATRTATVQKTAETLIHEITHHRYDIGGNQWAECVCRAQELKHRNRVDKLTGNELRDIIKSVKRDYPHLKWR